MKIPIGITLLSLVAASWCSSEPLPEPPAVAVPSAAELVASVRQEHPRLFLLDADLPALKESIANTPVLAGWYQTIRDAATGLLAAPPIQYATDARENMLGACRETSDRLQRLALVYRIEGDPAFAQRAIEDLMAACRLDSWDPKHFLDTAEMTLAVAIGYDWLYRELTPEQRGLVRDAICSKGLEKSLYFYNLQCPLALRYGESNWARAAHNWNQVCNGGMAVGALAVADEAPGLAGPVLEDALRSLPVAMAEFAPDGGWAEGAGYWEYATTFNVYLLAAVETAIGPKIIQPFLDLPGFDKTGEFRIHVIGPIDKTFNFADCSDGVHRSATMSWFARHFQRPVFAGHSVRYAAPMPMDLVWYSPDQQSPQEAGLPLDAYFRHIETVFFRGAWDDPNAVYVGFKGGNNLVNHGHLDLGSFVLDADGCRWALDLGRDDYALRGYFIYGKLAYYRLKTIGHNTLVFNGHDQALWAQANIVAFQSRPERAFAVTDLSRAYSMSPGRVLRGIALLDRRRVLVQDDLDLARPVDAAWQMHTRAEVALDGRTAVLSREGKTLTATILEPQDAVFEVLPADPPPPQAAQPDVRKLVIRRALSTGPARLAVLLSPGDAAVTAPTIEPLANWIEQARPDSASPASTTPPPCPLEAIVQTVRSLM